MKELKARYKWFTENIDDKIYRILLDYYPKEYLEIEVHNFKDYKKAVMGDWTSSKHHLNEIQQEF